MIRLLIPMTVALLLSACAGTVGMNTHMPCTHCKEHCKCHETCRCEDGESCLHCAEVSGSEAHKPCKICMESERASAIKVNQ